MPPSPRAPSDRLHLLCIWQALNDQFFLGRLPSIAIIWSSRLTASAGMFASRTGPRARLAPEQTPAPARRQIRLSVPLLLDQPEPELLRTLAHEMIHQWQYDVLRRRPDHGPDFQRMRAVMNAAGLGITVRHTLGEAVRALTKYRWRCQQCGELYERQRRTIRPRVHRCGSCRGALREVHGNGADAWRLRTPDANRPRQLALPFARVPPDCGMKGKG